MAVSGGEVIINVLANTSQFQEGIARTEAGMVGLASAARSGWGTNALLQRSGLDKTLTEVKGMQGEATTLAGRIANLDATGSKHFDNLHAHARRTHFGFLGISSGTILGGAGLVAAAQAFHHIQEHLQVTGDKALTTAGRIRNAFSNLLVGDVVGAIGAFDKQRLDGTISELEKRINEVNRSGAIGGGEGRTTRAIDAVALLFGTDRQRARQFTRLKNVSKQYAAAIDQAQATALGNLTKNPIDLGSALVFGERGSQVNDPRSIGPTVARGAGVSVIHVHGVDDPVKVAHKITTVQNKQAKSNPRTRRGRVYNGRH